MEPRAFDPLDFLRLADELAADDADEAALRTAIGRAYYAVFLLARSKTPIRDRRAAHVRVRESISPTNQRLASLLGGMSRYRDIADYEPIPANPQFRDWRRNWEIIRRNANDVLDELSTLSEIEVDENA
jgi:hypothetical protein